MTFFSLVYGRCCDELLALFHHTLQLALPLANGLKGKETKGCKHTAHPTEHNTINSAYHLGHCSMVAICTSVRVLYCHTTSHM
jgi:hypothetical protein